MKIIKTYLYVATAVLLLGVGPMAFLLGAKMFCRIFKAV